ncbi:uncharacterized protein LOC108099882 [Drosophila ficusphila]|uniref:uncharacterized protein LOC108099882 n=1 Tax=Drosophila ficusphila TaxID=30025 RepID=UPI0007E647AB|nr:uncharacterized protein LOC108099882 [Drosophila ficusphila]
MMLNSCKPPDEPCSQSTFNGGRQNCSLMTQKGFPSRCNGEDEYQEQCPSIQPFPNEQSSSKRTASRSQSAPRPNKTDSSDCHHTSHIKTMRRGPTNPNSACTTCDLNDPGDNHYSTNPSRNNTPHDCYNTSQVGMNYGEFRRRNEVLQEIQRRRQRQEQSCQQKTSNNSCLESDDSIIFEPGLNSTTIVQDERRQQSVRSCPQQRSKNQNMSSNQMCDTSRRSENAKTMCDFERTREMQHTQTECESPQSHRGQTLHETTLNKTSYLPPECTSNSGCCQQSGQKSCCGKGSSACKESTEENQSFSQRGNTSSSRNQSCLSGRSCINQTSFDKSNGNSSFGGRSMRMHIKPREDRLTERIQNDFLETLVKDRFCPGVIQASLDGREDFNVYAREISFAGAIPNKPIPVDPITMIEAIKLRIDYERKKILKEKVEPRSREKDSKNRSNDGKSRRPRPVTNEDIDSHFGSKNRSEVNEGVAAFLKAETEYRNNFLGADTFDAHIHSYESHLVDESIKVNSYTATTTPTYQ